MELYSGLFESMLNYCCRSGLRRGPVYTLSMMALALAASLNLLSIIGVLWMLGVLNNPLHDVLHPPRYLCALLCVVFIGNSLLARRQFSAHHGSPESQPSAMAAPLYLLGSVVLFVATVLINLHVNL